MSETPSSYCSRCGQVYLTCMLSTPGTRGEPWSWQATEALCVVCRVQTKALEVGTVNVYRLRERLKISQEKLAQLLTVSKRTVTRWESGELQRGPAALLLFGLEVASNRDIDLEIPDAPAYSWWSHVLQLASEVVS